MDLLSNLLLAVTSVAGCILAADFLTGLVHWAEDTWLAPGRSVLLDRFIIDDNVEHHRRPGAIRSGSYLSTNGVTLVLSAIAAAGLALGHVTAWQPYLIVLLLSHSNQVHKWAHGSNVPYVVGALQRWGVLQAAAHHAGHQKAPYGTRYCALTNALQSVARPLRVLARPRADRRMLRSARRPCDGSARWVLKPADGGGRGVRGAGVGPGVPLLRERDRPCPKPSLRPPSRRSPSPVAAADRRARSRQVPRPQPRKRPPRRPPSA